MKILFIKAPGHELFYVKKDSFVILAPSQLAEVSLLNVRCQEISVPLSGISVTRIRKEAISWYREASFAFRDGLLKISGQH